MSYILIESYRRLIQIIFGIELFDFPVLQKLRGLIYRSAFRIGKRPIIEYHVRLSRTHRQKASRFKAGDHLTLARNAYIDCTGNLEIGDNVIISAGAEIHTHEHPVEIGWTSPGSKETILKTLKIGSGAWIGSKAIILPGVSYIGENAVIGAGSVVTKDVEKNCVVAGNPARVIRMLEEEEPHSK